MKDMAQLRDETMHFTQVTHRVLPPPIPFPLSEMLVDGSW